MALPTIDTQTNDNADQNRETLQRSIRGGLGALGLKIKNQTSVLASIANTMKASYNVDQQALLVDAENRLEATRKDQAEADEKAKEGKLTTRIKGGLLQTLKKAFIGGAIIGAIALVVKYWDQVKVGLGVLGKSLVVLAKGIVDLGLFIVKHIDKIGIALFAIWSGKKLIAAYGAMKKGVNALVEGYKKTKESLMAAKEKFVTVAKGLKEKATTMVEGAKRMGARIADVSKKLFASAKEMAQKGYEKIAPHAKRLGLAIKATSIRMLEAAKPLVAQAKSKIVQYARVLAGAMSAVGAAIAAQGAALMPALIAAAPFVAIAAGVALALYGLKEAFDQMRQTFKETGSVSLAITEGLSALFGTIVGFVPDLLKSATSWILGKLGFDEAAEALDSFSISDFLQNGLSSIFDNMRIVFMKAVNGIVGIVNSALDFLPMFGPNTISSPFDIEKEKDKILDKNLTRSLAQQSDLEGDEPMLPPEEVERLKKKKEKDDKFNATLDAILAENKEQEIALGLRDPDPITDAEPDERSSLDTIGKGNKEQEVAVVLKDPNPITDGAELNERSSQAAAAAGNVVVTTIAPTNVNAPTSTNVSSQTNVTPTASRSRNRSRRGRQFAPA